MKAVSIGKNRVIIGGVSTQGSTTIMARGGAVGEKKRAYHSDQGSKALPGGEYPQTNPIIGENGIQADTTIRFKDSNVDSLSSDIDQIDQGIFIGNVNAASSNLELNAHGITHIINATAEIPNYYPDDYHYIKLGLHDRSHTEDLIEVLEPSYRYIEAVKKYNKKINILVHCHAGVSRSASIVIYYLMRSKGMTYDVALAYVRSFRPIVNPNPWYEKQLRDIGSISDKLKTKKV
jgi:protein-tyrosine phosphatase